MATRILVKGDAARLKLIASPWHLLIVMATAGLNAYRGAIYAVHARSGLGPSRSQMYLRTVVEQRCGFLQLLWCQSLEGTADRRTSRLRS